MAFQDFLETCFFSLIQIFLNELLMCSLYYFFAKLQLLFHMEVYFLLLYILVDLFIL